MIVSERFCYRKDNCIDPQDLLVIALRASLIYFFLVFIVRILGKRAVGNTSAFDLIVALMLGEVVDEVIYGDVSLVKGILAIVVIAAWHFANSWASARSGFIDRLTGSAPRILVENGKIKQDALFKERVNPEEVFAELRLQSIDDVSEVKLATLEPNGQLSVLKEDWAKPIQKLDVFPEKFKEAEKNVKGNIKELTNNNQKIQNPERSIVENRAEINGQSQ